MFDYKYAIIPGEVMSMNDTGVHYITAPQVAKCYGVDFRECIVIGINDPYTPEQAESDGLIILRPDSTGEYKIPCKQQPRAWFNNNKESENADNPEKLLKGCRNKGLAVLGDNRILSGDIVNFAS